MPERAVKGLDASSGAASDSPGTKKMGAAGTTSPSSSTAHKRLSRRCSTNPHQLAQMSAKYNKSKERIEYSTDLANEDSQQSLTAVRVTLPRTNSRILLFFSTVVWFLSGF